MKMLFLSDIHEVRMDEPEIYESDSPNGRWKGGMSNELYE